MNIQHVDFPPHADCDTRDLSEITLAIVHHSDTPADTTVLQIDQMHRARNFVMFGYSFAVGRDGSVTEGRKLTWVPAAAQGENRNSVDIVLIGQYEPAAAGYNGPPPAAQIDALVDILVWVHQQIPTIDRTITHQKAGEETPPPDGPYKDQCPGKDVIGIMPWVLARVTALLAADKQ